MNHIAIDLGGVKSQVCVRNGKGQIVHEAAVRTQVLPVMLQFKHRRRSRVIVETCAEAFAVADAAKQAGHEVRVVPATLVRTLGVGARGIKTDLRDARILSEVSSRIDLPSVHVRSQPSRDRKSMIGMRTALVGSRTQLINSVRGWLRTRLLRLPSGTPESFPVRVRKFLSANALVIPSYVERQLLVLDELNTQLKQADKELEKLAHDDPTCRRLMSAPGVGSLTAVLFVATLDQVERFANAKALTSYLGLTPGEHSSSERKSRTGITKAGSPQLRWALGQCCWSAWNHYPHDPLVTWAHKVAERRGRRVAIVAMARKLATIVYAMLRDEKNYRPDKVGHSSLTED